MKKILMISGMLSVSLFIHGCGSDTRAQEQVAEISYSVIHSDYYTSNGELTNKGSRVFSHQEGYFNELVKYSNDESSAIDFSSSRVLLIDMGPRSTGGFSIEVGEIRDHDEYIKVEVTLLKPGNNCMVAQAITNPYQFLKLVTSKEVLINEELRTIDCE